MDQEFIDEIASGLRTSTAHPMAFDDVPGWFGQVDKSMFEWVLTGRAAPPHGNVVELGTYLGKSAVHIGRFVHEPDEFFVCDLFGEGQLPETASPGARIFYSRPIRNDFENNYRHFHERLPVIIQAPTAEILNHVPAGSCRFVHVDASHEYADVRADIRSARTLLEPGGVVALDDYRAAHTPGAAAAVWEAVTTGALRPFCLSADKLYGTWGDASARQEQLTEILAAASDLAFATHHIMGQRVIRLIRRRSATAQADQRSAGERKKPG